MVIRFRDPERRKISQEQKRRHVHHPGVRLSDLRLLPNILTLSRLLFILPAVLIISRSEGSNQDIVAGILLMCGFITDMFDGIIARTFKMTSDLGKILDPLVDKVVVISTAAALTFSSHEPQFPIWLFGAILVRDGMIFVLATRALREDHHLFVSSWTGKATTFATAMTLMIFLLDQYLIPEIMIVAPWVVLGLLTLSSVDYLERYWSVRHKRFLSDDQGQEAQ
ncbi:MAG: CDP-alcohol phosphatidyltransferase family protein [bacterium]